MRKCILTVITILLLFSLPGCVGKQETQDAYTPAPAEMVTEAVPEQKLCLSVTESESPGYTRIPQEALGGKTDAQMVYGSLSEVRINLDGIDLQLEEAVREEKITVPELFAFARVDARSGLCQEEAISVKGLTHFTYTYPEWKLELCYDIYETPNGEQTLVEEIYVYPIMDRDCTSDHFYLDEESEWGYYLDREDWGLTFTVSSLSPTRIVLDYTQQRGQEIGELTLEGYSVYPKVIGGARDTIVEKRSRNGWESIPIRSDGSGQIVLDWSETDAAIPPGEYCLWLGVVDNYGEEDIHPLMVNYHDSQGYGLFITIE